MVNMDETSIYLNMPASTTVHTVGSKKINIRTRRQENWENNSNFNNSRTWIKLAPLLIFKAKEGKDT